VHTGGCNMRKRIAVLWLAVMFCGIFAAQNDASAVTKEEIITLAQLGISPDEIVKAIEKDRTIFNLEINDILELKNAGVPEEVIRFMLQTPQRYGTAAPIDKKPDDVQPDKQPIVEEKTPEEIKAEAERARLEALRMKQEQDKARQAQLRAFAEGQLKQGMEWAEDGRYVDAIKHFQKFVADNNYTPDSDEYYNARYGIALALVQADLYRTAADLLLEIVLQGPDKPFFQPAFNHLRTMRQKIEFSPPNLEQLTNYFVGNFSKAFQDNYNYFLGEFFYEGANYSMALKYFEQISEGADDYARALYLRGLVQVANQMYKSAVQSFQQSILAQESNDSDVRVAHLAYMALARIAYETGDYDASIFYYRKVPQASLQLPVAFYESGWSFFVKGDFSRALGTFHALHSPYFGHYFYPELWILEATIYLNMCHYEFAKDAIGMFRNHVSVLGVPLAQFMQSMRTPAEYYMALMKILEGDRTYNMPEILLFPVLSNVEFFALYRTIDQISMEIRELQKNRGVLGRFAEEKLAVLEADKVARMNEIGIKIQQVLRNVEASLREYEVKVTEIELDLNQVEMEKIEMQTQMLLLKDQLDRASQALVAMTKRNVGNDKIIEKIKAGRIYRRFKKEQVAVLEESGVDDEIVSFIKRITGLEKVGGGSVAIVGSDALEWPFEGDYWADELWGYRSFLKEECLR
jgi:tetratricopeptide (TPR) repeat protein